MKQAAGIFLFILFTTSLFAQTPVAINGALRVEGDKIVNKNDVAPQLRGISFSWSLWQGRKYYNPVVVDWLTSDFKVSLVRASMGVQPDHGYLQEPALQKQLIVNVVDQAIKDGIYVLIDWHDHHSNQHLAQSKDFFAEMAQKYKGVPNVIYEIWNEPEAISWDTVKNYAVQVIREIRKYDPDNLIVVGSPHWDQDVDLAATNSITGFKNIAYSFHFYASDPSHQEKLRAKGDLAIKKGLALMITEWGVGESNGNGKFNRDQVKTWMEWMEANHLSWTNWNITDKQETTALLLPGAPETGNWTEEQLTPAGIYIREKLRELNK
ncbi:glycoside hydrolase family 5 protein [Mucilaginibacter sp. BJC16-A38]|uniref:glycoside hydrolase family 5 protein n=1 Tax=Mucilaginibacter phenanthrenivorans TaxID=1234842 RepID=UPI002157F6FA|nr:glycoside hydrolase family 5 protein [Mucilaginibacter phenanthrenivorans]MCR8559492.1 glycoside hydrolase family 5 protein [Mucilaginibacter phenanthrenivorans]